MGARKSWTGDLLAKDPQKEDNNEGSGIGPDLESSSVAPGVEAEGNTEVHKLSEADEDDRPMTVLPRSGGTVTGTAIYDWLNDAGQKFAGTQQKTHDETPD
jgi:hypothetical protein